MGRIGVVKGFEELIELGWWTRYPPLALFSPVDVTRMIQHLIMGSRAAVPGRKSQHGHCDPEHQKFLGVLYQILWELMQKYGGAARKRY